MKIYRKGQRQTQAYQGELWLDVDFPSTQIVAKSFSFSSTTLQTFLEKFPSSNSLLVAAIIKIQNWYNNSYFCDSIQHFFNAGCNNAQPGLTRLKLRLKKYISRFKW